MPDQKISVDPAAADLSGCIIPVVTGGINKQAANSLFGITGVANGVIYSAGNRNTSDPTNFNYVPTTQTLTVVGPIRTSPVTNEATVATPANGMIIYSTALSKFRAYENGAWVNLIGGATPAWLLASGGTLTGANTIDQTTTAGNILKFLTPTLGVTPIDGKGLWIANTTAAAAGAQQISGSIVQEGQGWATTPVASQSVKARQYVSPGQAASNPNLTWVLQWSVNNAAYVNGLVLQYGGANTNLTITGLCSADSFANAKGQFSYSGNDIYVDNSTSGGAINFRVNTLTQAMKIQSNGDLSLGSTSDLAKLYVLQPALSSSWLPALRIDPGAHTSLTAATEFFDYNFNTRAATWLAGTTPVQRFAYFQGQTVAGATASATFTDLYTVYISPSIAGTNAIVTNNWALGLGGALKVGGNISIPSGNSMIDALGKLILTFSSVASAVNQITITNAGSAAFPTISATGTDADIGFNFVAKGTGALQYNNNGSSMTNPTFNQIQDFQITHNSTDAIASSIVFYKARGSGLTTVANSDVVGSIRFNAYDGSSGGVRAQISAIINGTVSTGVVPTDLVFYTTAASASTERLRILSSGLVGINIAAPLSTLDVAGSLGINTRTIIASATLAATDCTVLCDSTSGIVAVTLPAAAGAKNRVYVIKKINAGANNVTLATVDGGTKTITTQNTGYQVQSDGSLWYVIGTIS